MNTTPISPPKKPALPLAPINSPSLGPGTQQQKWLDADTIFAIPPHRRGAINAASEKVFKCASNMQQSVQDTTRGLQALALSTAASLKTTQEQALLGSNEFNRNSDKELATQQNLNSLRTDLKSARLSTLTFPTFSQNQPRVPNSHPIASHASSRAYTSAPTATASFPGVSITHPRVTVIHPTVPHVNPRSPNSVPKVTASASTTSTSHTQVTVIHRTTPQVSPRIPPRVPATTASFPGASITHPRVAAIHPASHQVTSKSPTSVPTATASVSATSISHARVPAIHPIAPHVGPRVPNSVSTATASLPGTSITHIGVPRSLPKASTTNPRVPGHSPLAPRVSPLLRQKLPDSPWNDGDPQIELYDHMGLAQAYSTSFKVINKGLEMALVEPYHILSPHSKDFWYHSLVFLCERSEGARQAVIRTAQAIDDVKNYAKTHLAPPVIRFMKFTDRIKEEEALRLSKEFDIPYSKAKEFEDNSFYVGGNIIAGLTAKPIDAVIVRPALAAFNSLVVKPVKWVGPACSRVVKPIWEVGNKSIESLAIEPVSAALTKLRSLDPHSFKYANASLNPPKRRGRNPEFRSGRRRFTVEDELRWSKDWKDFTYLGEDFFNIKTLMKAYHDGSYTHFPVTRRMIQDGPKSVSIITDVNLKQGFVLKSLPIEKRLLLDYETMGFRFVHSCKTPLNFLDSPIVKLQGTFENMAFSLQNYIPGESFREMAILIGQEPIGSAARKQFLNELSDSAQLFGMGISGFQARHPLGPLPLHRNDIIDHLAHFEPLRSKTSASLREVFPSLSLDDGFVSSMITSFERSPGCNSYGLQNYDLGNFIMKSNERRIAIVSGTSLSSNSTSAQREIAMASNTLMRQGIPLGMTYEEVRAVQNSLLKGYRLFAAKNQETLLLAPAADRFFDYQFKLRTIGGLAEDIASGQIVDRSILERLVWDVNQCHTLTERSHSVYNHFANFFKNPFKTSSISPSASSALTEAASIQNLSTGLPQTVYRQLDFGVKLKGDGTAVATLNNIANKGYPKGFMQQTVNRIKDISVTGHAKKLILEAQFINDDLFKSFQRKYKQLSSRVQTQYGEDVTLSRFEIPLIDHTPKAVPRQELLTLSKPVKVEQTMKYTFHDIPLPSGQGRRAVVEADMLVDNLNAGQSFKFLNEVREKAVKSGAQSLELQFRYTEDHQVYKDKVIQFLEIANKRYEYLGNQGGVYRFELPIDGSKPVNQVFKSSTTKPPIEIVLPEDF
jgi:hypothetical protein